MRSFSRIWFAVFATSTVVTLWACVGDDPASSPPTSAPDAASEAGQPGVDGGGGTADAGGDADAAKAGPRCDPSKPFAEVTRLKGISSGDDEHGIWVSSDELTAYVAVTPQSGSGSTIRKSTRSDRDADFSAHVDAPELAAVNAAGYLVSTPSMSADGLVLFVARDGVGATNDGIYVALRESKTAVFAEPVRARTRANPFSLGDPFLVAGGESLFVARDNGISFELDEAPRDITGIYGDGGFVDYAVAPDVVNVNDETAADRFPVVSHDRLTLVFSSNRAPGSGANTDLYLATRAGPAGVFTTPARLPEPISSNAADVAGTISDDGCVIYFTSNRAGGFGSSDVYIATRGR
jgi:hypothetical protein